MKKLSAQAAFAVVWVITTIALSLALSIELSGEGASLMQKLEIVPFAAPFVLMLTAIGGLIFGVPSLLILRALKSDQSLAALVVTGALAGCLFGLCLGLVGGGVPGSGDARVFYGFGSGTGALAGGLWWVFAKPRGRSQID